MLVSTLTGPPSRTDTSSGVCWSMARGTCWRFVAHPMGGSTPSCRSLPQPLSAARCAMRRPHSRLRSGRRERPGARARIRRCWAELIETRSDELARIEALGSTRPINEVLAVDIPYAANCLRTFAECADTSWAAMWRDAQRPLGLGDRRALRRRWDHCTLELPDHAGRHPRSAQHWRQAMPFAEAVWVDALFLCCGWRNWRSRRACQQGS